MGNIARQGKRYHDQGLLARNALGTCAHGHVWLYGNPSAVMDAVRGANWQVCAECGATR